MKQPRKVPTIRLDLIDAALRKDADAHRLVAGRFVAFERDEYGKVDYSDAPTTKAACESVGRCANGSLLFYSSFPLKKLIEVEQRGMTLAAHKFERRVYGLLPMHVEAIISINDSTNDADNNGTRYEEVMAMLTFVEWAQQAGVRFANDDTITSAYRNGWWNEDDA